MIGDAPFVARQMRANLGENRHNRQSGRVVLGPRHIDLVTQRFIDRRHRFGIEIRDDLQRDTRQREGTPDIDLRRKGVDAGRGVATGVLIVALHGNRFRDARD